MIERSRNLIDNYSIIDNRALNDKRLTFEARGLLAYLLSKPHNWKVSPTNIQRQGSIGKFKTYAMLKELIEHGYAERVTRRDPATGKILATDYLIRDQPLPTQQETAQPDAAESPTTNN